MQAARPDIKQGITQEDVERMRKRVQIGDKIVCRTLKACDMESPSLRTGVRRVGTVIAKYPYFAVVRLPGGTRETIRWTELLTAKIMKGQEAAS
jgi:hypothetical protein